MIKKYISLSTLIAITTLLSWPTLYANEKKLTVWDTMIFFAKQFKQEIPETYNYINLDFKGVAPDSDFEDALQILIYKDLISNSAIDLQENKIINLATFEKLAEQIISVKTSNTSEALNKSETYLTESDLKPIQQILIDRNSRINISVSPPNSLGKKWEVFYDVYNTLSKEHYDREDIQKEELIEWAIMGLTESIWDKYTSYFPATDSESFFETLNGEYEWIGAYVELSNPWEFIIVSPIVGSPAEQAWLKGWDQIIKVDDNEVKAENPSSEIISWIKWPSGTTVELTVLRQGRSTPLVIEVERWTIVINDVEYSKLDRKTAYIQIKNFWEKVDTQFIESLEQIAADEAVTKIIIDVRNNPGWYLNKVSNILWYFVPKWEATAIVSYGWKDLQYTSTGKQLIDFNNYELVALQNGWSASASEIMIWTIKDYYPETTIIWEQSFWKWSVQSLKSYNDGSTLKYTTARWYTGKSRTWIDWIGITPDILLPFDAKMWSDLNRDNQLQEALEN